MVPSGLYARLCHAFSSFIFFHGRLRSPGGSEANGPIFTKISGLVEGCKGLITPLSFFIFQGTLPWQPIKVEKLAFFPGPINFVVLLRKRIAISQFWFQKIQQNEFLYIVYKFGGVRSRNLRVYDVNNSTFCGDMAKIGISRKISQNILDLSWPTLQVW